MRERASPLRARAAAAALAFTTTIGVLLTTAPARANGRFPGAVQLVKRGDSAVLTSSFGVFATNDSFGRMDWVCEQALGYDAAQNNDLGAAIFGNGAMAISGPAGLTISPDRACTNTRASGIAADRWMSDVSVDGRRPEVGLGLARGPRATGDCEGALFETVDNGATWAPFGAALPSKFCALTVDSAPSRPERIYLSGNVVGADGSRLVAQLLVSDDRGATFTAHEIPNEARPFIGAVDPLDPDIVYVRTTNPPAAGNLLVSRDGGKTFEKLATMTGIALQFFGVTGIAISPDGSKLAYGSVNEGLFVMEKGGTPEKRGDFPVLCLTWSDDGLYACSAPILCSPFFVAKSSDEGRTFSTLLPTPAIDGEHSTCASSTPVATECPGKWAAYLPRLSGCVDGGALDAGDAGDAGVSPPRPPSTGCDCTAGPITMASGAGLAGSAFAIFLALLRTRASRQRRRRRNLT